MAKMAHSFSSGMHAEVNYTWSKELDYTSTGIEDGQRVNSGSTFGGSQADLINPQNNKHYGLADQPSRFVGILTYESPFGKGKHFALSNSFARAVAGNWTLGSVVILQSGVPFVALGGLHRRHGGAS
jgi:trimeric autotransporter adhesin